jgi:hypothetical protein
MIGNEGTGNGTFGVESFEAGFLVHFLGTVQWRSLEVLTGVSTSHIIYG